MNEIPEYASVILFTPDNEIVLQLRDDNPKIVDPNLLSLFAGRMKPGESPEQGARREVLEETTLNLGKLEFLMTYQTDVERFGGIRQSHVFIARDINVANIDVREGQGYRLIRSAEDLENHNFALISKEILKAYFAS